MQHLLLPLLVVPLLLLRRRSSPPYHHLYLSYHLRMHHRHQVGHKRVALPLPPQLLLNPQMHVSPKRNKKSRVVAKIAKIAVVTAVVKDVIHANVAIVHVVVVIVQHPKHHQDVVEAIRVDANVTVVQPILVRVIVVVNSNNQEALQFISFTPLTIVPLFEWSRLFSTLATLLFINVILLSFAYFQSMFCASDPTPHRRVVTSLGTLPTHYECDVEQLSIGTHITTIREWSSNDMCVSTIAK
jgi:hypothetical protein